MTALIPEEQLIKSQERVRAHGEVFTPKSIVNEMLDLVKPELESGPNFIDKTFFEPAAGSGNFLTVILQRKLRAMEELFDASIWQTESLFALASIYGIELLEDNHQAAQDKLLSSFLEFQQRVGHSCGPRTDLYRSAVKIINCNIIHGNTLSGVTAAGQEIQMSWWKRVPNRPGFVQREPFSLESLRNAFRNDGMIDFMFYELYKSCHIEEVYREETCS